MKKEGGSSGAGSFTFPSEHSANSNLRLPFSLPDYAERNFSIPFELRKLKQWGIAKAIWNEEKGKYEKFPFQINGQPAKSNDSSLSLDFLKAFPTT